MCYGLASLLFLFFAFRKIYSHPSLFAGLGCKPLEKGENLRIIDVPPPPQRNIALVFLSVSLPGKLWWVLLLFSPLHLLEHHAVWLKVLLQLPNSSGALIHWRVQVMYFYSWDETANYEFAKRERWLSFFPNWSDWHQFHFNWQHNRLNVSNRTMCLVFSRMSDVWQCVGK